MLLLYIVFPNMSTTMIITITTTAFFFFLFYSFIYLFLAALGLHCCTQAFSSCSEQGLLFIAVRRLLIEVASLVVEHGLQACGLQQLWHMGSAVVARGLQSAGSEIMAHGLSCSAACGIFLDQGLNLSPALAGRFLTTAPPGKYHSILFKTCFSSRISHFGFSVGYLNSTINHESLQKL